MVQETHLDRGDATTSMILLEPGDVSTYRVCPIDGEPWEFTAPPSEVGPDGRDLNRDGVADLFFFGGTGAWYFAAEVYIDPIGREPMQPLRDLAGEPITISGTAPAGVSPNSGRWFACDDLDGDGRFGLGRGDYEIVGDVVHYTGTELTLQYGQAIEERDVSGTVPHDPDALWPQIGEFCGRPDQVRTMADTVCAELPAYPGGEPHHGFTELTDVAPVEPDDILVSLVPNIDVYRDGENLSSVLAIDRDDAPAYHDGRGGIVAGTRALDSVLHVPVDGDPVEIVPPAAAGVQNRLLGVEEIDGVWTAMVKQRIGEFNEVEGTIEMIPLDGSARWSLPSFDYSEGGLDTLRWTGDVFIATTSGEASASMFGLDRRGEVVDLPWNSWEQGWGDGGGLYVSADGDTETVWIAARDSHGRATLLLERDARTGAERSRRVLPGAVSTIDLAGDQLLLQSPPGGCIRLLDPATDAMTELHHGGHATVG